MNTLSIDVNIVNMKVTDTCVMEIFSDIILPELEMELPALHLVWHYGRTNIHRSCIILLKWEYDV